MGKWHPDWEHFEFKPPAHWIYYTDIKSKYPEDFRVMLNVNTRKHRLLGALRKVREKVAFQGKRKRRSIMGKKS